MPSHYDKFELCRFLNLQWINNPMSPKPQICHGAGTVRQTVVCGPWWGMGKAGDLDLAVHWWLVRSGCVQQEIWKAFLYVAPIFRCVGITQCFCILSFCILKVLAILGMAGLFVVMKMLVVTLTDLFFEKLLIFGHQDLCQSHYTIFYNRYLWKLLAGLYFSFGMSCEKSLAMITQGFATLVIRALLQRAAWAVFLSARSCGGRKLYLSCFQMEILAWALVASSLSRSNVICVLPSHLLAFCIQQ